jgi:hypothetical protein
MRRRQVVLPLVVAALGLTVGACGQDEPAGPDYRLITPPAYAGAPPIASATPGKEPVMTPADAKRLRRVLAAWADAVRRGEAAKAARYFSLPAIVYQASYGAVELRSAAVAKAFNQALPCGARLVKTRADGRYIVGTFTLQDAEGRTCATPGEQVRVGFVFGDRRHPRRFTEWWQVPDGADAQTGPAERPLAAPATAETFSP